MIRVMMNLNNYAENHGKKNKIIFVLIDLKREIKENFAFVMRVKTLKLNALRKRKFLIKINVVFNQKQRGF